MTIIYIHGVKVRSPRHGIGLEKPFRRWLAEKVSVNGAIPGYEPVYWGDIAANFRWGLASRPKTYLLAQGGDDRFAGLGSLREAGRTSALDKPTSQESSGPVLGGPPVVRRIEAPPLSSIARERRADFLADLYLVLRPKEEKFDPIAEDPSLAALADAAAEVASDWDRLVVLEATEDSRAARLIREVDKRLRDDDVVPMGGFADWISKAGETMRRAAGWPGDAVSTVFAELRPTLNEFVAYFIGDVLTYMNEREVDGKPGEILRRAMVALRLAHTRKKETGESIIVVTHSMGGQLFYDAINYFAPLDRTLDGLEVDHWISFGAQVSFFAEINLLKGQADTHAPGKLGRPHRVKAWTNFYDRNDFVGFIMEPVFDGVFDSAYDTGYGLAFAHTGFLSRPSFFQAIANTIASPRESPLHPDRSRGSG